MIDPLEVCDKISIPQENIYFGSFQTRANGKMFKTLKTFFLGKYGPVTQILTNKNLSK